LWGLAFFSGQFIDEHPRGFLRGESLKESDSPPDPDVVAQAIVEDLETSLEF